MKPRIRFKGYTDAWEQRKLGDCIELGCGKDYKHLSEGDIPVYGTGGYMLSVDKALSYEKDGIGIGRKGTIDKPYLLKAPFWTVDTLFFAIPKEKTAIFFLLCLFSKIDWKSKDESTGVPSLSKQTINAVDINVPKTDEQKSIGAFFQRIDNLITLHQRKYDKIVNIKKALLEKMFPADAETTPKIRFSGFTDAWEQRKFNSIAKRITEMTDTEDLPRVEYEDIVSGQGTLNKDINKKKSCKMGILFDSGDVLFGKLRPYLKNWLFASFMGVAVGDFWVLRANNADGQYIYTLLQIDAFQDVANQSTGTKMPRADWSLVSKQRFFTPTVVTEQRKIGEFFKQLDNLITLHQRQLEKLKNIKSALLEKMFV